MVKMKLIAVRDNRARSFSLSGLTLPTMNAIVSHFRLFLKKPQKRSYWVRFRFKISSERKVRGRKYKKSLSLCPQNIFIGLWRSNSDSTKCLRSLNQLMRKEPSKKPGKHSESFISFSHYFPAECFRQNCLREIQDTDSKKKGVKWVKRKQGWLANQKAKKPSCHLQKSGRSYRYFLRWRFNPCPNASLNLGGSTEGGDWQKLIPSLRSESFIWSHSRGLISPSSPELNIWLGFDKTPSSGTPLWGSEEEKLSVFSERESER